MVLEVVRVLGERLRRIDAHVSLKRDEVVQIHSFLHALLSVQASATEDHVVIELEVWDHQEEVACRNAQSLAL